MANVTFLLRATSLAMLLSLPSEQQASHKDPRKE